MRFTVDSELVLFADSVRAAIGDWSPPLEPVFGEWWDERDDALASRLADAGWDDLGTDPELLGALVAGSIELGRAVAPLCLVDDATLGGPLVVEGRARHGTGRVDGVPEPTIDGTGTLRDTGVTVTWESDRLRASVAATLGYLAGLADAALSTAVEHAKAREQFGAPLATLPAVQARLADSALARDGLLLVAWGAADPGADTPLTGLAWAGSACREVTAHVHQVHGGIGFALEGGVHRYHRRARSVQVWNDALLRELGDR